MEEDCCCTPGGLGEGVVETGSVLKAQFEIEMKIGVESKGMKDMGRRMGE